MSFLNKKIVRVLTCAILFGIAASWIVYGFIGRSALDFLYFNPDTAGIADRVMRGRSSTPVDAYYRFADRVVFSGGLTVAILYLVPFGYSC